jgi:hypothetical protein
VSPSREPDWYIRGLGCFRAVLPAATAPQRETPTILLGGLAWWLPPRGFDDRPLPTHHSWRTVHRSQRRWTLTEFAPCWSRPDGRVCTHNRGRGCEAWGCDIDTPPAPHEIYLDPRCADFESKWDLEEVWSVDVAGGQTSQSWSTVITSGARIALFRVNGPEKAR